MPVFTIETPTGRKLDIEAADEASAVRGAQEWDAQQNPAAAPDTSMMGAVQQGVGRNLMQAAGETLKQYGPEAAQGVAETLKSKGADIANPNYKPAQVVSDEGVDISQLPRAVVESSPTLLAALAAARATPGPWWAKALAGGVASTGIGLGDKAKERAAYDTGDPNAEPTAAHKGEVLPGAALEAGVGAVGIGRLLPGAGKAVRDVGARGVADAAKKLGTTGLIEGGVEAAQSGINQVGRTAGTERGLSIDQNELANAAIVGGATGGAFASPRAAREASDAVKFRDVDPESAAEVSNRLNATGLDLTKSKEGFKAVSQVQSDLVGEVRQAARELRVTGSMTPEASNALRRAHSGDLTDNDIDAIADAAVGTSVEPVVNSLVRQTRTLRHLTENFGNFSPDRRDFAGGISGQMDRMRAIFSPAGTIATSALGAAAHSMMPAGMGVMSLPTLGAIYGGYAAARGLNKLTGSRSPTGRFARKFADDTTPVRPRRASFPPPPPPPPGGYPLPPTGFPGQAAPAAPGAPWGARPYTQRPTGPGVNPGAQPQAPYNAGPGAPNVIYGGPPPPQAALPPPSTIYQGAGAQPLALPVSADARVRAMLEQLNAGDATFKPRDADRASAVAPRIEPALQDQVRAQNLVGRLNDMSTTLRGQFPTWNEERVRRLTQRLAKGATTQQIADEFGLTKNAIIGKIDRLGLREALKPLVDPPLSDDIVMDVLNEPRSRAVTPAPAKAPKAPKVPEREPVDTSKYEAEVREARHQESVKSVKQTNALREALVASVEATKTPPPKQAFDDYPEMPEFLKRNKPTAAENKPAAPAKPAVEKEKPTKPRAIDDNTPLTDARKKALREAWATANNEEVTVKSPEGVEITLMSHTSKGMSAEDAAIHITDMLEATGKFVPDDKGDFITKRLEPMLQWKDETAARLAELTGIEVEVMIPHFRAIPTRTVAREVREELQAFAPKHAKLIGNILGEKVINSRWRKK
jgi:hypothetical protein